MRGHRWLSVLVTVAMVLVTILLSPPVQADPNTNGPVFEVMNTSETPPDGVWFRNSPHVGDTDRVTGHGVYANEEIQLQCYAWGDAVGPYNDSLWYYVLNVTRETNNGVPNVGMLNAHYINDGKVANVVDAGVPACVDNRPPSSSTTPAPTVTLAQGPAASSGFSYSVALSGFPPGSSVPVTCYDSTSPGGFFSFRLTTDSNGAAATQSYCYSGDGPDHWVVAGGVQSNHVAWQAGSTPPTAAPPPPPPPRTPVGSNPPQPPPTFPYRSCAGDRSRHIVDALAATPDRGGYKVSIRPGPKGKVSWYADNPKIWAAANDMWAIAKPCISSLPLTLSADQTKSLYYQLACHFWDQRFMWATSASYGGTYDLETYRSAAVIPNSSVALELLFLRTGCNW
jgi:hypothetical protein